MMWFCLNWTYLQIWNLVFGIVKNPKSLQLVHVTVSFTYFQKCILDFSFQWIIGSVLIVIVASFSWIWQYIQIILDSEAIFSSVPLKYIEIYISAATLSDCFFRLVFWGLHCWQASALNSSFSFFTILRKKVWKILHIGWDKLLYQHLITRAALS